MCYVLKLPVLRVTAFPKKTTPMLHTMLHNMHDSQTSSVTWHMEGSNTTQKKNKTAQNNAITMISHQL